MTGQLTRRAPVPRKNHAALALRTAGASYDEIAQVVGYQNATIARREVVAVLAESATDADRSYHRNRAQQRLETLLDAIWDTALDRHNSEQLPAVRAAREIVREMILLQGAAQPAEVIVHNPTTEQLLNWFTEHGIITGPAVVEVDPFADTQDADYTDEDDEAGGDDR